jgi:phage-related protein
MRILVMMMVIGCFLVGPAHAAGKTQTPQQQKMSACAKENKGKKGDEYKQAMSACLNRDVAAAPAETTQQQKMAACAKANKGKKGDEYKQAMSACLAK